MGTDFINSFNSLTRSVSMGTPAVGIVLFALCLQAIGQSPVRIQIRVLNAKNGERVANQKVSVGIKGVGPAIAQ